MNPAPLIPITFTREIERIEHRHPYFFKQVPGQVVYAPETTTEIIEEQQVRFARRFIKRVEGDVPARIWNGEDLNRKRVAYLGDGMLGDALIHTAVWRELKYRYPTMDLHAFVSSGHPACDMVARFNRDIGHVARRHHMTLTREQLESFDYLLTPRNVGYLYRGSCNRDHAQETISLRAT